jgi:hypothetical protein
LENSELCEPKAKSGTVVTSHTNYKLCITARVLAMPHGTH